MNDVSYLLNQPFPGFPPISPIGEPVALANMEPDRFESHKQSDTKPAGGIQRGLAEVKMHTAATLLMGAGTLLMNFIPGLKMSWSMAGRMAIANMLMMVMIAFGLGVYRGHNNDMPHDM